jgi:ubiquinone/menaquinone biosynthesis C-methylase UbiE
MAETPTTPPVPTAVAAGRTAAQAAAFDRIGDRYDQVFPHKDGQLEAVARLIEHLHPGARVLDAGCGTGLPTTRQLVDAGMDVVGIDISPVMLDLARANAPGARFVQADVLDVDQEGPNYDAATAFFSLLMLPRSEISVALRRLHQALVPGGWLVVAMVEAELDDVPIPFLGSTVRVSGYPRHELAALVEAAGFRVDHQTVFSYAPAASGLPPEVQIFLSCQRGGGRDEGGGVSWSRSAVRGEGGRQDLRGGTSHRAG